jgi:chemotaxis protein CheD
VHFFPATGKVQLKKLHLRPDDAVHQQEREYRMRLAGKPGGGDIELFSAPR